MPDLAVGDRPAVLVDVLDDEQVLEEMHAPVVLAVAGQDAALGDPVPVERLHVPRRSVVSSISGVRTSETVTTVWGRRSTWPASCSPASRASADG